MTQLLSGNRQLVRGESKVNATCASKLRSILLYAYNISALAWNKRAFCLKADLGVIRSVFEGANRSLGNSTLKLTCGYTITRDFTMNFRRFMCIECLGFVKQSPEVSMISNTERSIFDSL